MVIVARAEINVPDWNGICAHNRTLGTLLNLSAFQTKFCLWFPRQNVPGKTSPLEIRARHYDLRHFDMKSARVQLKSVLYLIEK